MNKILITALCIINFTFTDDGKNNSAKDSITVIKFMYLNDYPMAINMKTFWDFPEEHAQFNLPLGNDTFLTEVAELPIDNCENFTSLRYAFVVKKHGSINDTVYADTPLKTWIFKRKKKVECHYDLNAFYAEFLREHYPFFKGCW